MVRRRDLLIGLPLSASSWSLVRAQEAPRTIGHLSPYSRLHFAARLPTVAERTGLHLSPVDASTSKELDPAFRLMTQQRAEAVLVMPDGYFWNLGAQISELALRARIPSMFAFRETVEVGGLMKRCRRLRVRAASGNLC
jgi:hypothetical protein